MILCMGFRKALVLLGWSPKKSHFLVGGGREIQTIRFSGEMAGVGLLWNFGVLHGKEYTKIYLYNGGHSIKPFTFSSFQATTCVCRLLPLHSSLLQLTNDVG